MKKVCTYIFLIGLFLGGLAVAGDSEPAYSLYLVRHAEKVSDGTSDPGLTPAGELRAASLAGWLSGRDIQAIWSSDYKRTRDSAAPSARKLMLETRIYDPRDQSVLQQQLHNEHQNALVVGHSNTIPALVSRLCDCEMEALDESQYDQLYLVTINEDSVSVEVLDQSVLFK
jgi:broad specificity phosphatase PhoE